MSYQDHAENQLPNFHAQQGNDDYPATTNSGNQLANKDASLTAGPRGLMLIQDVDFLDEMSHFDRERIPERVVHAKGGGAFGYFQCTHDITQYSAASVFIPASETKIAIRFSTVIGESGSADTLRDPRGFAVKFYTPDGIWDIVGNSTPIFFIRDSILFPSFIHSFKRNPATHLHDANAFWDFLSLRPESTHQTMFLFANRGIPDGFRRMHGYGSNTFSLVNKKGELTYCKFHIKTNQGICNIPPKRAAIIAGEDPDYAIRDLYNNISKGNYPSWSFYIQVMTPEQAAIRIEAFDVTKVWCQQEFPLIPVGQIVLNKNPNNYFAEIEQAGFNPANMIPGIGASPDRMLQGRLFAYGDTHRYRLGTNYLQLPVNSPRNVVHNFSRDGQQTINNQGGAPNYHPNSFGGPNSSARANFLTPNIAVTGISGRYDIGDEDNFSQPQKFYKNVLKEEERRQLAENIANHLKNAYKPIQDRTINMFSKVDTKFGRNIRRAIDTISNSDQTL